MPHSRQVLLHLVLFILVGPLLTIAEELVFLYPQSSFFQFTIGLSVPIRMDKRGGLVFSSGFQFNYALPWNLTQFESMVVQARAEPPMQQLRLENIYTALEDLLERNGWEHARECVLRTICEFAETPLSRSGQDVVEEIIHLLLTQDWYIPLEELLRRGNPGKDCIKRSICESAETPLRDDGLVGEIFHVLLTPDYGGLLSVDAEYGKAAEIGRRGHDCLKAYPSCPPGFGILDSISKVFEYD